MFLAAPFCVFVSFVGVALLQNTPQSFVKGRPAQRETTTTTTTTVLMASRPEPGSFWGGRRGRRFVLAALVDEEGKEKDRAPNGRHDKTSQKKNRMLLADFDVRRRRTPRGGGGALFFVAAVFFGAVLFFFGGEGTIEESEVRGGRRTHQRRGLLAESAARGEKNIFSLLESEMPPPGVSCTSSRFVSLLARAMRDFLTIQQPRRLFARLTMRRATSSRQNDRKLLSSRVEDSLGRRATRREARVGIGKLRTDVRRHWRSVRRIFIRVGRDEVHARGERILVEKERRIRFLSKETGAESIRGEPKCVLADERFGGFDICCHKWYNR